MEAAVQSRKKYSLGSDVDKEVVFDFHFLLQEETVSYIKEYGKVMFIIRGPPSTGKATLSEMLTSTYPEAAFCCADSYFRDSFTSPVRNRESTTASHDFCRKKAKDACVNNAKTIIVQNTHIRKWEMQPYVDLAAEYNYTVIMAITLYRFDVTPEALLANNTDGLDLNYFRNRLRQWEDVSPVLTGWFLGPNDATFLLASVLESLKELVGDGKFCRVFDVFDPKDIVQYFKAKKVLFSLAGYTENTYEMKKHYLSDIVQYFYGKCFTISILGYHISTSGVLAIVHVNNEMRPLIFKGNQKPKPKNRSYDISYHMQGLEINHNMFHHSKVTSFKEEDSKSIDEITAVTEDWGDEETIEISNSSFIELAVREDELFDAESVRNKFQESMQLAADSEGCISYSAFTELENGTQVNRLDDNSWLVRAPKKIIIETIYSGLYV